MVEAAVDQDGNAERISWLEGRYYADLAPAAEKAIRAAGLAWQDEPEAERKLALAAALAPGHMAVLIAHYRYNLYKHRYAEARDIALRILTDLAQRLTIPADWRQVRPEHADFAADDADIRAWLFVLQAYGYVLLRLGDRDQALAALHQLVALDRVEQTHARALLRVIERAGTED